MKTNKAIILKVTKAYNKVCHVSCFILRYERLKHDYELLISKLFYFHCDPRCLKYIVTET
jgi:hypothetical protein